MRNATCVPTNYPFAPLTPLFLAGRSTLIIPNHFVSKPRYKSVASSTCQFRHADLRTRQSFVSHGQDNWIEYLRASAGETSVGEDQADGKAAAHENEAQLENKNSERQITQCSRLLAIISEARGSAALSDENLKRLEYCLHCLQQRRKSTHKFGSFAISLQTSASDMVGNGSSAEPVASAGAAVLAAQRIRNESAEEPAPEEGAELPHKFRHHRRSSLSLSNGTCVEDEHWADYSSELPSPALSGMLTAYSLTPGGYMTAGMGGLGTQSPSVQFQILPLSMVNLREVVEEDSKEMEVDTDPLSIWISGSVLWAISWAVGLGASVYTSHSFGLEA
ncbi:hypothetical protein F5887DRAFT_1207286 [Amanita rubescens]|nr:hypothetical protein F5887DRAFT_1207286 [Amanita rubescens]